MRILDRALVSSGAVSGEYVEDEAVSPAYAEGKRNRLIDQCLFMGLKMRTTPSNQFVPPDSRTSALMQTNHAGNWMPNEEYHQAKITFLDQLKRTDTDGVKLMAFSDEDLEAIAHNKVKEARDDDGNIHPISPELRKAAQIILDNGGVSAINPGGDIFTSKHLEKSIILDDVLSLNHGKDSTPAKPDEPNGNSV